MRSYISYDELEELGETIVRAYINKTRRYNALCVDIEGLVTDYLGLTVVYETIVEDDLNKIAFLFCLQTINFLEGVEWKNGSVFLGNDFTGQPISTLGVQIRDQCQQLTDK